MSSSRAFLSTTLDWARKIIQGAMVVPTLATNSEKYCGSLLKRGTSVAERASPQSGPIMTPATT